MMSWRTSRALESFRELSKVIDQLTEDEVYYCLRLEVETQRRKTVIDRLVAKAADFHRQHFITALQEKIHGTSEVSHPLEG